MARLYVADDVKSVRDRALLLIGFFGAFRRGELAKLDVDYLTWEPEGLIISLPRSKTDQSGQGKIKAIPYGEGQLCAVTALKNWLDTADIEEGSVFEVLIVGALSKRLD